MEEEVTISRQMLKAIGAETRIAILKSLRDRQKTQSELATELKLTVPTVLEHMEQLEKAKLIERIQDDVERKWKYYRLTNTGRSMVEGKKMHVMVLLTIGLIITLGVLYLFLNPFAVNQKMDAGKSAVGGIPDKQSPINQIAAPSAQPTSAQPTTTSSVQQYPPQMYSPQPYIMSEQNKTMENLTNRSYSK